MEHADTTVEFFPKATEGCLIVDRKNARNPYYKGRRLQPCRIGDVTMTLGEKIKEQRKKIGYTQEALAERMDVSRQAVAKWEKNLSSPTAEKLVALSSLFGMSLDDMTSLKVKTARRNNNYRLAAIVLQLGALASCANISYSEIDGVISEDKTVLMVKILVVLIASAWMAVNVYLEDDAQQRRKNTIVEFVYCVVQVIIVSACREWSLGVIGAGLLLVMCMIYIFAVNPRVMKRELVQRKN